MIEIKDLLARFNDILLSEEAKREAVRKAISSAVNININSEDIKIKNSVIYLDIKPIYKNEIFLKQEEIFLKLKKFCGKKAPEEIR